MDKEKIKKGEQVEKQAEKEVEKEWIIVWYGGIIGKATGKNAEEAKEKIRQGKGIIEPLGGKGDFSYEMYEGEKKKEYKERERAEGKLPMYAGVDEWVEIIWRRCNLEEMINKAIIEREKKIVEKIMKEGKIKYIRVWGIYEEENGKLLDWDLVKKDMEKEKVKGGGE